MLNPITEEVAAEIKAICDVLGQIDFLHLYIINAILDSKMVSFVFNVLPIQI